MIKRTVLDATRELLRELGLTTVFGNPGTTEVPFLTDWPDDFDYVLGLQESAVVAMADGYSQATRQAVLVNLHSAGGVGHGLGNLFNAYRNRTPLIVVAGQQTRLVTTLLHVSTTVFVHGVQTLRVVHSVTQRVTGQQTVL